MNNKQCCLNSIWSPNGGAQGVRLQDNYPDGNILWFNDFYLDEDRIIFSAGNFNGLYEYFISEKKLNFLGNFKDENLFGKQLYGKVHQYKDKLVFTPLSAENIAVYDMKSKTFASVPLPIPKNSCGFECKFTNSIIYGNQFFLFPGYVSYIVEYDLEKDRLIVHDDWYDAYIRMWGKESDFLFGFDMVAIQNAVYLASIQHSGLFKYYLDENKYEFIEMPGKSGYVCTLSYDGKFFWCGMDDGKLLKVDCSGKVIQELDTLTAYGLEKGRTDLFVSSIFEGGWLWLFLSQESTVLKINCNNIEEDFEIIRYSDKERQYTNFEYHTVNGVVKKNGLSLFFVRSDRTTKCIMDGGIKHFLAAVSDSTGWSEKTIEGMLFYDEYEKYEKRRNNYFHKDLGVVLIEETPFTETLDYLINNSGVLNQNGNGLDNRGKIIYENC